jgi:hypothetical protein
VNAVLEASTATEGTGCGLAGAGCGFAAVGAGHAAGWRAFEGRAGSGGFDPDVDEQP